VPCWYGCGSYGGYYYPAGVAYAVTPVASNTSTQTENIRADTDSNVRRRVSPAADETDLRSVSADEAGQETLVMTSRNGDSNRSRKKLRPSLRTSDPEALFEQGYSLYWEGRYQEALDSLEIAVQLRQDDARLWYFKALCERALGLYPQAAASARQGRASPALSLNDMDRLHTALERVQGADRRFPAGNRSKPCRLYQCQCKKPAFAS
jgi:tetratricopeptide (TPR) repeat protein